MIVYKCDRKGCDIAAGAPLPVELKGYYPDMAAGILLPENFKQFHFCSPECFLEWIRAALLKESR